MNRIRLFEPEISPSWPTALKAVAESKWLGMGQQVRDLEIELERRFGIDHVIATNSCTSALQMALHVLDLPPGSEVIVPTMTFCSTAHIVIAMGHTPIFADVDDMMLIDWNDVAHKMTNKTGAVIPVHFAGRYTHPPFDWLDVPVIHDCAHAFGSMAFNDVPVGRQDLCCFSFHAVKTLPGGDGGCVTTSDPEVAERLRRLRWLGIDKSTHERNDEGYAWEYDITEIGYKCHMNDITAAILLYALQECRDRQDVRNCWQVMYQNMLRGKVVHFAFIRVPRPDPTGSCHIMWLDVTDRDKLYHYLSGRGIDCGIHYRPLHTYKVYKSNALCPNADRLYKRIISIPCHSSLSYDDVQTVSDAITEFYT